MLRLFLICALAIVGLLAVWFSGVGYQGDRSFSITAMIVAVLCFLVVVALI